MCSNIHAIVGAVFVLCDRALSSSVVLSKASGPFTVLLKTNVLLGDLVNELRVNRVDFIKSTLDPYVVIISNELLGSSSHSIVMLDKSDDVLSCFLSIQNLSDFLISN